MKAIVYEKYGSPDVLRLAEIEKPVPVDDQILVKIHAVSINGSDRENLVGRPLYTRLAGLVKPSKPILGSDVAGVVVEVGQNHTEFEIGDEVFGEIPGYHGGFTEYVCMSGSTLMHKPKSLSFEQAAAIPQAGVIAWNGICKQGKVKREEAVLINGAGGSGGSYAIQLAKRCGAEVTGVDNANKLDYMRALGADHAIAHTQEDFTKSGRQYDFIFDLIAHRGAFAYSQALRPNGRYYAVGGSVSTLLQLVVLGPLIKRMRGNSVHVLAVPQNRPDLISITELIEDGQIEISIDRIFAFEEIPDAFRYINSGQAKGKVVINVIDN